MQHAIRANPAIGVLDSQMNDEEKRVSAVLMRVNHVREVCAQAMYSTHALATNTNNLRMLFVQANLEESAPLAWTKERIKQLSAAEPAYF